MPKPRSVFRITHFKNRNGSQSWRVTGTTKDGRKIRSNFPTKALATGKKQRLEIEDLNAQPEYNLVQTRLSETQVKDAERAFQELQNSSLHDAVLFYKTYYRPPDRSKTLVEALDSFIKAKENAGRRPRTIDDLKSRVGRLASAHPDLKVHEIRSEQLESMLTGVPQTQVNYIRAWKTFFSWTIGKGFCSDNPASLIERPSVDRGIPVALSLDQVKTLLQAVVGSLFQNFVVLQLFCGLRRGEVERLSWDDVHLKKKIIVIQAGVAKKRDWRNVKIPECAIEWLDPDQQIYPPSVEWKFKKLRKQTGISDRKYSNVLRHTAISFHCAKHKDINLTKHWAGTGVDPIYNHYRALVDADDAELFWSLTPENSKLELD
ncbi:MAG: tyrosine-type recombinase/integrase [Verrucomicrobia bacterium]|jgi:integrase|nr:tyrosine-type recombinase/integrase [Verrucomicrobiota bacterium]